MHSYWSLNILGTILRALLVSLVATTLALSLHRCTEYDCAVGNYKCPDTPEERRERLILNALFCQVQYDNCVLRASASADPTDRDLDACSKLGGCYYVTIYGDVSLVPVR